MLDKLKWTYFDENGYVHIKNFIEMENIRPAKNECIRIANNIPTNAYVEYEFIQNKAPKMIRKIRRIFWTNEMFWKNFLNKSGIASLIKKRIGKGATLIYNAAFFKRALFGGEIAPHQDQSLWEYYYPNAINVWVPLDKATRDNGCIYGYKKSHLEAIHHINDTAYKWHQTIPPSLLLGEIVYIPANPGDIIIWHSHFVHGSTKNTSSENRLGVVFVFADSKEPNFRAKDSFHIA